MALKRYWMIVLLALLLGLAVPVRAEEPKPTEIATVEDLLARFRMGAGKQLDNDRILLS